MTIRLDYAKAMLRTAVIIIDDLCDGAPTPQAAEFQQLRALRFANRVRIDLLADAMTSPVPDRRTIRGHKS
jgi:hypothetical protein